MSEKNLKKETLSLYKSKASKTFQTPSQLQGQPGRAQKAQNDPQNKNNQKVKKTKNLQNEGYHFNE